MNLSSAFSFKVSQMMARYRVTYSQASQGLAIDNADGGSIQTTGLVPAFFDGDHIADLPADAAKNATNSANETVTAWANNTSYTLNTVAPVIRSENSSKGSNIRFRLLKTHTSNEVVNKPHQGSNWDEYWVEEPHSAVTAKGSIIGYGNTRQVLVLANRAGELETVLCGGQTNAAVASNFRVPQFDPHTYCPVGLLDINYHHTSGSWTFGTDNFNATNCTTEYIDLVRPLYPHIDNIKVY
jgi:hypothetical protein